MQQQYKNAGKGDLKLMEAITNSKTITVQEQADKLAISKKWRSSTAMTLFIGMSVWTGIALAGLIGILIFVEGISKFFLMFIPLVFIAIGSFVLSKIAMGVLNTSSITITADSLTIKTSPIEKGTNKQLRRHEIKQLFVKGVQYDTNKEAGTANEANKVYGLYYIDMHGQTKPLFLELPVFNTPFPTFQPEEGQYIEQKIEQFWGINDVAIKDVKLGDVRKEEVDSANRTEKYKETPIAETVATPPDLELIEDGEELIIVRDWKTPLAYMLLLIATFFGVIGLLLFGGGIFNLTGGGDSDFFGDLVMLAVAVLLIGIAVSVLIKGLSMRLNKTTVHLTPTSFELRHAPFYRSKGISMSLNEIEKIYVEEQKVVSRNNSTDINHGMSQTYYVGVLMLKKINEAKPITLSLGLSTPVSQHNLYVAYKVNEYIKRIKD